MNPSASEWIFRPNRRRPEVRLTDFQSWAYRQVEIERRRVVVPVAARRSGKSTIARLLAILAGLDDRPGDVGYMAPTLEQARRLFWRPLMEDLREPAARQFVMGRPDKGRMTLEFVTGTRLYVYSAEAHERVRGDGFKRFITDETGDPLFTDEVFDETLDGALAADRGQLIQIGTPKGRGRFYREFRKGQASFKGRDPEYASCQVTALQAGIVPADIVENARKTKPRRSFQQEYEARFNAPMGLIYDEWNETRHVLPAHAMPRPETFDEIIVGKDWGVAKRGALVVMGIDHIEIPGDDEYAATAMPRVWVLDEVSEAGRPYTDAGWWKTARQIQRQYRPTRWYCDPAGGKHEEDDARAAGLLLQLSDVLAEIDNRVRVIPADNQVNAGISAVQSFMHYDDGLGEPPRLFVSDSCKFLIDEIGKYSWASARKNGSSADDDGDSYEERPRKVNDHAIDAARYALFSHFYKGKRKPVGRNDVGHEDRGG